MQETKKLEIKRLIDKEHGEGYHKNVNLSGYTIYRKDSFISFRFIEVKQKIVAVIEYVYITNKKDLIKLLSFAINFFVGKDVAYVYYKEHKRKSNYVETYFPLLEFSVNHYENKKWKFDWESTNGYKKEETLEVYL